GILKHVTEAKTMEARLQSWLDCYVDLIERWQRLLANLRTSSTMNLTMFYVATRELLDITQTSLQATD
ncbi:MAG: hypothetical protein V3V61_01445, partial [Gammaproteobacteria bacterium]